MPFNVCVDWWAQLPDCSTVSSGGNSNCEPWSSLPECQGGGQCLNFDPCMLGGFAGRMAQLNCIAPETVFELFVRAKYCIGGSICQTVVESRIVKMGTSLVNSAPSPQAVNVYNFGLREEFIPLKAAAIDTAGLVFPCNSLDICWVCDRFQFPPTGASGSATVSVPGQQNTGCQNEVGDDIIIQLSHNKAGTEINVSMYGEVIETVLCAEVAGCKEVTFDGTLIRLGSNCPPCVEELTCQAAFRGWKCGPACSNAESDCQTDYSNPHGDYAWNKCWNGSDTDTTMVLYTIQDEQDPPWDVSTTSGVADGYSDWKEGEIRTFVMEVTPHMANPFAKPNHGGGAISMTLTSDQNLQLIWTIMPPIATLIGGANAFDPRTQVGFTIAEGDGAYGLYAISVRMIVCPDSLIDGSFQGNQDSAMYSRHQVPTEF